MLRVVLVILIFISVTFSKTTNEEVWPRGESLITFLNKQHIQKDIYFNLSKTDKELCSEIEAGVAYQIMYDKENHLDHVLIPISEEMQIHIYKNGEKYILEIIPIIFESITDILTVTIQNSPYQDIIETSNNKKLANEFVRSFKKSVNFRKLHKGDKIVIKYIQKMRMGNYFGAPVILGAFMKIKYKKAKYIFQNPSDGRYYDINGRSLTSVFFKVPLRYKRISSKFTYKRFHPILKRYIAHLGVDYAAPRGRKIWATASGKVIFRGRKGGYGNAIMIRHSGGYKSLYGHLYKFNKKVRKNSWVKQGDLIGYVGTSGRSTGPHLHFGLYKNGRAVNPSKVMSYSKKTLSGKSRKKYLKYVKNLKKELNSKIETKEVQFNIKPFKSYYSLDRNTTIKS
ncbi:MAG: peptidoglycan DD-metalloendopeptidase family protein [Arcobacteraceae bacterium]|nr:peptidoglycan DD-metalloendopeptidase family protein [Arcobacteraceae bacterium]